MAAEGSGLPRIQQEPSESLPNVVDKNGAENVPKDKPGVSSPECLVPVEEKPKQPRQHNVERCGAKLSIYRIPDHLKEGDVKAYVPQTVSLGPYHHSKEHLRHMDQHKLRCFCRILKRTHRKRDFYLDWMKEVEQRARNCYEGIITMSSDDFVHMMVLDGCFVIELLQGVTGGFMKLGYPSNDPIFSSRVSILKIQIQRDMTLLENQIPLFILDRLLGLQLGNPNQKGLVVKLVLKFFDPLGIKQVEFDPSPDQCMLHCLDVLWQSFLPSDQEQKWPRGWWQNRQQLVPCLTELVEAGIKFRCSNGESLGDIQFQLENGILEIPSIQIHQGTRSLFLNLIAFEQSHFNCRNNITSYVIFMHNLINSSEDVQYLRHRKNIQHCLGRDAMVAELFQRLCQEVPFDIRKSYLQSVHSNVEEYFSWKRISLRSSWRVRLAQKWNAWRAILESKYFDNPWSIISFIAAVVLLVLTFLQALYAIYGYYTPHS